MSLAQLSIVIPCLDEAARIEETLAALQPMRARGVEIILVDGGSTDGTVQSALPLVDRIAHAPRGRSSQMNAGASIANGKVLLFLHADCILPQNADRLIIDGLHAQQKCWGRFDIHLDGSPPLLKLVAFTMNWRSRLSGIATGDQGIFVNRASFDTLHGFLAIPLMEDIDLSRRLKTLGAPLCLNACIRASGRRWEHHGTLRTILLMWFLRFAYWLGASPVKLARIYASSSS